MRPRTEPRVPFGLRAAIAPASHDRPDGRALALAGLALAALAAAAGALAALATRAQDAGATA